MVPPRTVRRVALVVEGEVTGGDGFLSAVEALENSLGPLALSVGRPFVVTPQPTLRIAAIVGDA